MLASGLTVYEVKIFEGQNHAVHEKGHGCTLYCKYVAAIRLCVSSTHAPAAAAGLGLQVITTAPVAV